QRVGRGLVLDGEVPALQVPLGDIDHVAGDVADLPLLAAGLDLPVGRVVDQVVERLALVADHVQHERLGLVRHRVDPWADGAHASSLRTSGACVRTPTPAEAPVVTAGGP